MTAAVRRRAQFHRLRVARVDRLTDDAAAVTFDVPEELVEEYCFRPGQSLTLRRTDGAWLRDVGSWDPLPWYLAASYATVGRAAQHAFWGPDAPDESMLAQLGIVSGSA